MYARKQVKIRIWHLAIIAVIALLGAGIGGRSVGQKVIKQEIEQRQLLIDSLQQNNAKLLDSINNSFERVDQFKKKEKDFYDEYIWERKQRLRLQKQNAALLDTIFGISYLDSLADHYRFKIN